MKPTRWRPWRRSGSSSSAVLLAQGGKDTLAGAKALIRSPVKTVDGAVSGVGKLFERAGASPPGDPPSDAEDGRPEKLIGFSSTKRDDAAEFGVDPDLSNPVLQERRDQIAWEGTRGRSRRAPRSRWYQAGPALRYRPPRPATGSRGTPRGGPRVPARQTTRTGDHGVSPEVIDLFLANTGRARSADQARERAGRDAGRG